MAEIKVSDLQNPDSDAWSAIDNHVAGTLAQNGMSNAENLVIPNHVYNRYYAQALERGETPEAAHGIALVAVVIVGELCQTAYRANRDGRG